MKLSLIGSGPVSGDLRWTRDFFTRITQRRETELSKVYGWALHHYANSTGKKEPFEFTVDEWYELLGKADRMESLINQHWSIMGEIDKSHSVKLIVDEWSAWHNREADMPEKYLWAYSGTKILLRRSRFTIVPGAPFVKRTCRRSICGPIRAQCEMRWFRL